jgi:hypothetical protein
VVEGQLDAITWIGRMTRATKGVRPQLVRWDANVRDVLGAWKVCSTAAAGNGRGLKEGDADETQLSKKGRLYQMERHLHMDLMIAIQ